MATLGVDAHPAGIAALLASPNTIYVADSGTNSLLEINLLSHSITVLATGPGPLESLRTFDGSHLVVTVFSASVNKSSVFLVDPVAGQFRPLALNLTAAVDAAGLPASNQSVLVLENQGAFDGSGQVIYIDDAGRQTVLASGFNDPTSLAVDQSTGQLLVYSRGDGVVYSIPLP